MSNARTLPLFRGRSIGIALLVSVQFLVGAVHVFFGFWLLSASAPLELLFSESTPFVYSVYTVIFGSMTLLFTLGLWIGKSWGWFGTVSVSLFVTTVDALALLNLPSIPGTPKFAAVSFCCTWFSLT